VECTTCIVPKNIENLLFGSSNFRVEIDEIIANQNVLFVALISLLDSLVFIFGLFNSLVSGFVRLVIIVGLGSIGRRHQVQNSVVAVVTQDRVVVTSVVTKRLPDLFRHISAPIKKPTINQNDDRLVSHHLGDLEESVLERGLLFH